MLYLNPEYYLQIAINKLSIKFRILPFISNICITRDLFYQGCLWNSSALWSEEEKVQENVSVLDIYEDEKSYLHDEKHIPRETQCNLCMQFSVQTSWNIFLVIFLNFVSSCLRSGCRKEVDMLTCPTLSSLSQRLAILRQLSLQETNINFTKW